MAFKTLDSIGNLIQSGTKCAITSTQGLFNFIDTGMGALNNITTKSARIADIHLDASVQIQTIQCGTNVRQATITGQINDLDMDDQLAVAKAKQAARKAARKV